MVPSLAMTSSRLISRSVPNQTGTMHDKRRRHDDAVRAVDFFIAQAPSHLGSRLPANSWITISRFMIQPEEGKSREEAPPEFRRKERRSTPHGFRRYYNGQSRTSVVNEV